MEYGVQIYTLREELKTPSMVKGVFKYLNSVGCTVVELAAMPKISVAEIKSLSEEFDVKIISSHSSFCDIKNNIYKLIADHLSYGAKYIGIGSMPLKYTKSKSGVIKFAKIFNKAALIAEQYGLSLLYHNHAFEFKKLKDTTVFEILMKEFGNNVYFCLDCYWAYVGNQYVSKLIDNLGDRLALLHFKDYQKTSNGYKMCKLGSGILDFKEYIEHTKKAKVKYALVELDDCANPRDDVQKSLQYLHSL